MANNHITLTPSATATRAQAFLNVITQGIAFREALAQYKASLSQYGAAADGDTSANAIVADFGLGNVGGMSFEGLVSSASDEAHGLATGSFIAQLLDRCG